MQKEEIRNINRTMRQTMIPLPNRKICLTRGVAASPHREEIITAFRELPDSYFCEDNDPYKEQDYAAVTVKGDKYLLKMSYMDSLETEQHGYNVFVMTIMHESEY